MQLARKQTMETRSSIRQMVRNALGLLLPKRVFAIRGSTHGDSLFITFDDGPHPEHTPSVLDALASAEVRGTFFVVGEQATKYPHLIRRIVSEGHAIGNHTWSHCDARTVSAAAYLAEVEKTQRAIEDLAGVRTRLFRPPHGKISAAQLISLAMRGYTTALWNIDSRDFACSSAAEVQERLKDWSPRAGDILLLHDRLPHASESVRLLISDLRSKVPQLVHRNLNSLCGIN